MKKLEKYLMVTDCIFITDISASFFVFIIFGFHRITLQVVHQKYKIWDDFYQSRKLLKKKKQCCQKIRLGSWVSF